MKKIWKLCIPKKICGTTPLCSYQENNCFQDIYDDDGVKKKRENRSPLPDLTISQRVENMCIRWKLTPEDAFYLIKMVDNQQTILL